MRVWYSLHCVVTAAGLLLLQLAAVTETASAFSVFPVQTAAAAAAAHTNQRRSPGTTATTATRAATVVPTTATTTAPRLPTRLYAKSGPLSCRPIGVGSAVPRCRIDNADLERVVATSDEWIRSRTGIGARRVLARNNDDGNGAETLRDLSVAAGRAALAMAGLTGSDLDLLICCTSTPDDLFGDAPSIAAALGCSADTVAFDLTAACSGFLFGAVTAGQFLTVSPGQRALVIGADALSRWVDWTDRNSCILFGDGAGAMVLESTDTQAGAAPGFLGYAAHSNGLGYCDLKLE